MEDGEYQRAKKRRRRRLCVIFSVIALLAVFIIIVGVAVGVTRLNAKETIKETLKETFKDIFIFRCKQFNGSDCEKIWDAFEQAYIGKDPCKVPPGAYDPLIAVAPPQPPCNRMMLWSKTKDVVHDFTEKRDCFGTMEDTLLGSVLNGLIWCGKEGSSETFTTDTDCPEWAACENNPVRSFWNRGSAAFAEAACGTVTAMLNGSIETPFSPLSIFGSVEVKRLNATKVTNLNIVLVTQGNDVSNCENASLKDLQKELDKGIKYNCKEVKKSQIDECASDPQKPCGACW